MSYEPSEMSYEPSEMSYEPSEMSYEPSEMSYEPSEMSYEPSLERRNAGFFGKVTHLAGVILLGMIIAGVIGLLVAIPILWLWNWLMPSIFGITTISYWEAWGLYYLAALLIKSTSSSSK